MKRFCAYWLAMTLLLGCTPALGEGDPWSVYESAQGFTILYPADLIGIYTVSSPETGLGDRFVALGAEGWASIWSFQVDDPSYPDWEARGYRRLEMDEPAWEIDVSMDVSCALYLAPNGTDMVEEIRLEALMSTAEYPAGFEYVFDLHFPADDPQDWRGTFESMLETLEFPPQAASDGSFRLDFFRGGAAGMRFTEVVVDEEAEPIVLLPQYAVTDFVLEQVTWDDETFQIVQVETLYTADRMGPGDNLKIFCWFSDMMPTLRVRCLNDEWGAECWYLSESGRDGSLLLLSPEEAEFSGIEGD